MHIDTPQAKIEIQVLQIKLKELDIPTLWERIKRRQRIANSLWGQSFQIDTDTRPAINWEGLNPIHQKWTAASTSTVPLFKVLRYHCSLSVWMKRRQLIVGQFVQMVDIPPAINWGFSASNPLAMFTNKHWWHQTFAMHFQMIENWECTNKLRTKSVPID